MSETEKVLIVKENCSPKKDAGIDEKAAPTQVKYVARDPLSKLDANTSSGETETKEDVGKCPDGTKKEQDLTKMVNDENGAVSTDAIPLPDTTAPSVDSSKDVGVKSGVDSDVSDEKSGDCNLQSHDSDKSGVDADVGDKSGDGDSNSKSPDSEAKKIVNGDTLHATDSEEYTVMHPKCADSKKVAADKDEDEYVVMHPPVKENSNGVAGGTNADAEDDSNQAADESVNTTDKISTKDGVENGAELKDQSEGMKVGENAIPNDETVPEKKDDVDAVDNDAKNSLEKVMDDNEVNKSDKSEDKDDAAKAVSKDSSLEKENGALPESDASAE